MVAALAYVFIFQLHEARKSRQTRKCNKLPREKTEKSINVR
jgi:hypothetical protein